MVIYSVEDGIKYLSGSSPSEKWYWNLLQSLKLLWIRKEGKKTGPSTVSIFEMLQRKFNFSPNLKVKQIFDSAEYLLFRTHVTCYSALWTPMFLNPLEYQDVCMCLALGIIISIDASGMNSRYQFPFWLTCSFCCLSLNLKMTRTYSFKITALI